MTTERKVEIIPARINADKKTDGKEYLILILFDKDDFMNQRRNIRMRITCPISSGNCSIRLRKLGIGGNCVGAVSRFISPNFVGTRKTKKTRSPKARRSYRLSIEEFGLIFFSDDEPKDNSFIFLKAVFTATEYKRMMK